jgi:hypothetical protein
MAKRGGKTAGSASFPKGSGAKGGAGSIKKAPPGASTPGYPRG